MKSFTLEQIAKVTDGMLTKSADVSITKIAPPLLADEHTLALALGEEEIENLSKTKAHAALVPLGVNIDGFSTIEVERPRLAMMKLITMFYEAPQTNEGIHPTAVIHPEATVGENVSLGANVVLAKGAVVGDNTTIMANCYIGNNAKIGADCFFHPGVNVGDRVIVGDKCIMHHGVSLGADGFSFVTENPNNIEQARKDGEIKDTGAEHVIFKINSLGSVVIGNNVEIGANTTIDRGTIENTTIGDNTKIDNLVMIGHNCKIGKGCMIVSHHIKIGADSIIAAKAGVTKSFPEKSIVVGAPAVPRKEFIKNLKIMKDAGELIKKFRKYEPLLSAFESEHSSEA